MASPRILIIWLDYHEYGLEEMAGLPVPRVANYGAIELKDMIKKHSPNSALLAGIEEGDGAQSPTPVVICSSSRPAGQGQDGGTPHISVGVPLGAVPRDKLIGAMTSTLGFY